VDFDELFKTFLKELNRSIIIYEKYIISRDEDSIYEWEIWQRY